jgi:hypothetical protein
MGAASSINSQTNCVYISYDYRVKNNLYIRVLRDELKKMNLNVIYSEITSESLSHLSSGEISENIRNIMNSTSYFILCVSKETIRSFHQAIEIDSALNSNKIILYLMIDEDYTPLNNQCVKGIVNKNKWMPFYSDENVLDSLNYLLDLKIF